MKPKSGLAMQIVLTCGVVLTITFIFANSSQVGEASSRMSAFATAAINGFFSLIGIGYRLSEYLARKLAHFCEYALLGLWLVMILRLYTRRVLAYAGWPLFAGLLVAVFDEYYQTFIPGRSGQVSDLIIDFGGVLAGTLFGWILLQIVYAMRRSRSK